MIKINENNLVNAKDLYLFVEVKTKFADWVKRCINYADLKENKDFFSNLGESTGGRRMVNYTFTIQAAKEVCIVSQTEKAKELRRWLIELSEKVERKDYLSEKQILILSSLIGFYKYVENQNNVESEHKEKYVSEHINAFNPYADFNKMRNNMLGIEPQKLDEYIKKYCIEHSKKLPKLTTKREKILFLDIYNGLKNAIFDFLSIHGEVNAVKIAELAKKMAKNLNINILDKNENNIFQTKELLSKPVYQIENL